MTDRKGLADRLDMMADERPGKAETLREAARALRQDPSVADVARVIAVTVDAERRGPGEGWIEITCINEAAQAIAAMYRGEG